MQNGLQSCTPAHRSSSLFHGNGEPSTLYRIQVYCLGSETDRLKAKLCFSTYFILKKNVHLNAENGTGRYVPVFLVFCWLLLGLKTKNHLLLCSSKTHTDTVFFFCIYVLNSQLLYVSLANQLQANGFDPQSPTIMLPSQKYLWDCTKHYMFK